MSRPKNELQQLSLRRFKRYPAYKDSGVKWLGKVPSHWDVKRLKHLAAMNPESLREDTDPDRELAYVDIGGVDGLGRIINTESLAFGAAPSRARRLVRHGDVIVSTVRTYLRSIAAINNGQSNLVVSTGFAVIRPSETLDTNFAAYALRAPFFIDRVVANSKGVSFPAIEESEMATFEVPVPPPSEQQSIAAFLARETARIDALIAKKERLLGLLEEEHAATINRTVTQGLDENARVRHSGIEWLGFVPAHWETLALRRLISGIEQGWSPIADDRQAGPEEWAVIKLSAVSGGRFRPEEHKALPADLTPDRRYEILEGDFLLTRSNTPDLVGAVCVARDVPGRLMLCDLVYRVHLERERIDASYLAYWLLSRAGRYQIEIDARGASQSMVKISRGLIKAWIAALPPLEEQRAIVRFLDSQTARIDRLVEIVKRAIVRAQELRTALIAAAVTGQIDVREESV